MLTKRSQSQGEDSQGRTPWIEVCHFQDFLGAGEAGKWQSFHAASESLWSPVTGVLDRLRGSQCELYRTDLQARSRSTTKAKKTTPSSRPRRKLRAIFGSGGWAKRRFDAFRFHCVWRFWTTTKPKTVNSDTSSSEFNFSFVAGRQISACSYPNHKLKFEL